ncbi:MULTISPECIES: tRNA glutamyl-Q(34) synthetase GluQRS [Aeromicrobium]|jgi:glutamyl-tRNA synthetase|uniref:Glutamyl-Q tRNA(Asp) ligase n=1 Tax=Aeromicrobium erythreum TaxID=2041 RepID=A0A0U4B6L6_9ACTN|nr:MULTISPECIES: tRNA glutamyl-Q(34) synthetase GluQRS [Aeromicrobium]ALX03689.1 glutamyl-Q tRNA(Asp) ligase [Aeromicrobium erythreum]MDR6118455.1 glutamyl-tRNA synthetase [Aeromicrobium sp. SORGH_AS_0981]
MPAGRFAPSPSGDLHVGNLRTALLAWLFARSTRRSFVLRVEDLDRVRPGAEQRQLDDLLALGLDWDGPVVRQSERLAAYDAAVQALADADLVYPCFCTRREVQEAPTAPHLPPGAYPGTCRDLTDAQRDARATARPAALRLRAAVTSWTVHDVLHGDVEGVVDDVVLLRNDGTPAYNLAVVVDDAAQDVDQVVRADDLLTSAARQAYLASLLDLPQPTYAHVPLAVNVDGRRLAKRDGAVTLADLGRDRAWSMVVESLGLVGDTPAELLESFDAAAVPRRPWTVLG